MNRKPKTLPLSITPETTARNAKKWLNIVRYGESGTIIQIQGDSQYRVLDIIQNTSLLKSILGPYYKKYLLAYLPLDNNDITEKIHETLLSLAIGKKIGTKGTLSGFTSAELLSEIGRKGYDVGLFVSNISLLLAPEPSQPLRDAESLIRTSKNFSVIVFSEIDITHPTYAKLATQCSFLFDHTIKYPLYEKQDSRQFMLHYGAQWEFSVPEKTADEIIRLCGGYLWLIHQIFRHLRDNPKDSVETSISDNALIAKLTAVWEKLDRRQKEVLRRVYFGTATPDDMASHEYRYLCEIRLIQANQLGIPLLSHVIENELKLSKWHVKDDKILIGGKDLTGIFTKKEKLVLSLLINSKHTLLSRDTIAKTIWADQSEEKYSDWAIDRLLYRVRTKLKKINPDHEFIKTVKKKGFMFR